jgi:DNA-binding IclR family transcriptional regulator
VSRPALAATRALEILNYLGAHPHESFSLSELARRLEVNVASTHAVLGALTDAGYLVRHPRHRTYALGPVVVALGAAALEQHPAIDLARDEVRRLAHELDLEAMVTAAAGNEIVFIARAGQHQPRGSDTRVGQRVPLVPPLGSVFVAWSPTRDVEEWLDRARPRLDDTQLTQARMALRAVRANGYSIGLEVSARQDLGLAIARLADEPRALDIRTSIDELIAELGQHEYWVRDLDSRRVYDVSMIAAPVFGPDAQVLLALTIVGFPPALSADRIRDYAERVRGAGIVVTKRVHGRIPEAA